MVLNIQNYLNMRCQLGKNYKMNKDRLLAILTHIKKHPESYDQRVTHSQCGTKHCIAGHADLMFWQQDCERIKISEYDQRIFYFSTWQRAKFCLKISDEEAVYLFWEHRTIQQIEDFVQAPITQYFLDEYYRVSYE